MKSDLKPVLTAAAAALIIFLLPFALKTLGTANSASEFLKSVSEMAVSDASGTFKLRVENIFNALNPFFGGAILYFAALASYVAALIFSRKIYALRSVADVFLLSALTAHIFGMAAHAYIWGIPPAADLHSSAVFAGAAAVVLGVFLYAKRRAVPMAISACLAGMSALVIAMHCGSGAETARSALNSDLWGALHSAAIMTGYGAVFLAGFLSSVRLVSNAFSKVNFGIATADTSRIVCNILCFSLVFCFAGTMLGCIADDMRVGRFWSWTPSANGSVIILFWCGAAVYAKSMQMCNDRAFLALAVFGNVAAAWGWFGVNLFNAGAHSCGGSGWIWFGCFVVSQFLIMPLALVKYKSAENKSAALPEDASGNAAAASGVSAVLENSSACKPDSMRNGPQK